MSNKQQEWLLKAATAICAEFVFKLDPASVLYSYGFPKGRGKGKAIGQCFYKPKPTGYGGAIFVHPCQWKTPLDVLHVLLHEIIHAETPGAGHKGEFVRLCKEAGLVKPWTATTAGDACKARLNKIAESLGDFPTADFDLLSLAGKKQACRLRLYECPCGVKVRVASDSFAAQCNDCDGEFSKQEGPK